jgi:CTP synthase (UTP-ammonia lyase)
MSPGARSARIEVGVLGDFPPDAPYRRATLDALAHAAGALSLPIVATWIPTRALVHRDGVRDVARLAGLVAGPGGPFENREGLHRAIRAARMGGVPFLGTCGGFQQAVLEIARAELGLQDAEHAEDAPGAARHVVVRLACSLAGKTIEVRIRPGTRAAALYASCTTAERTTCNYGIDAAYVPALEAHGLRVSGTEAGGEPRLVELDGHPFFVAALFQPQLTSAPTRAHPLVLGFARACAERARAGVAR